MGLPDIVEGDLTSSTANDVEDYVPSSYICRDECVDLCRGHDESLPIPICDENVNGTLAYEQPVIKTIVKLIKQIHGYPTGSA